MKFPTNCPTTNSPTTNRCPTKRSPTKGRVSQKTSVRRLGGGIEGGTGNGSFVLGATLLGAALLSMVASTPALAAPSVAPNPSIQVNDFADGKYPSALVPGRAIVKLHGVAADALNDAAGLALLKDVSARTQVELKLIRPLVLGWGLYDVVDRTPAGIANTANSKKLTEAQTLVVIDRLRGDVAIKEAQEDRWYRPLRVPDDELYDNMWHFDMIGMEATWDVTVGQSAQRIGVVDTGLLRNHPDLSPKDANGFDFISSGQQAADGGGRDGDYLDAGDGADCGQGFQGSSWHGSHVSGTIGASADDGVGVPGMNWNAGIVTARALGRCGGNLSDIMDGAAWMAGLNVNGTPNIGNDKVTVMNLSLGGPGQCSNFEQQVIDAIQGAGAVFVAAAGNDGGAVGSPANCNGVVSVAALGPDGNLTNYSSFGGQIEVAAPGGNFAFGGGGGVLSASNDNGGWTFQQGTSMASPHVAGAISLMQVYEPNLDRAGISALFLEHGVACGGCGAVPALRLAPIIEAISVGTPTPDPQPAPTPDPEPDNPPGGDAYEDNDTYNNSADINCGASISATITTNDVDYFNLGTVAAGTTVTIAVDGGDQDLDLYVISGPNQDDVIGQGVTETGQENVIVSAPGGRIDLVVQPWETAAGPYTLNVTCDGVGPSPEPTPEAQPEPAPTPSPGATPEPTPEPAPSPDASPGVEPEQGNPGVSPEPEGSTIVDPNDPNDDGYESNDTYATAVALDCPVSLSLIAEAGGEDWFEVTPGVGVDVRVVAKSNDGTPLNVIAAAGPNVEDVVSADDFGPGEIFFSSPTDRVAIRIASASPSNSPRYALDVLCGAAAQISPNTSDDRPMVNGGCAQTSTSTSVLALSMLLGLAIIRRRRRR